jgi:hypothetical protein
VVGVGLVGALHAEAFDKEEGDSKGSHAVFPETRCYGDRGMRTVRSHKFD